MRNLIMNFILKISTSTNSVSTVVTTRTRKGWFNKMDFCFFLMLVTTTTILFSPVVNGFFMDKKMNNEPNNHHNNNNNNNKKQDDNNDNEFVCRLWMGPSYLTSDTNHKFGLYAGIDYHIHDIVPSYEIGIPFYDYSLNRDSNAVTNPYRILSDVYDEVIQNLESMMWTNEQSGQTKWETNRSSNIFIPGIGLLANYHTGISNVDWEQSSTIQREPYVQPIGSTTPVRGCISPYYNFTIRATQYIPQGMELYAKYGNFDEKTLAAGGSNDIYQDRIYRHDYELVDEMIYRIQQYFQTFHQDPKMTPTLRNKIYDFMVDQLLDGTAGKRAKVYRSIIPSTYEQLQKLINVTTTSTSTSTTSTNNDELIPPSSFRYRFKDMIRSISWLQQHGMCVDTLTIQTSTIPHAGRGAFARRSFPKGTIISPVPLIPIVTDDIFELYNTHNHATGAEQDQEEEQRPSGFQQLLNYAFGHPESTLHFLTGAPMVNFINHAPTATNTDDSTTTTTTTEPFTANAYIEWSKHDFIYNDYGIQDVPISDWNINEIPSLVINIVALRDIDMGEEILFDYGPDWVRVYNEYVYHWQIVYNSTTTSPTSESKPKWPLRAQDVRALYSGDSCSITSSNSDDDNNDNHCIRPYPVNILQGMTPYPPGVVTACHLMDSPKEVPDGQVRKNRNGNDILIWNDGSSASSSSNTSNNKYKLPPQPPLPPHRLLTGHGLVVCDLMDRIPIYDTTNNSTSEKKNIISYQYTILTRIKDQKNKFTIVEIRNVPHYAITLIDRPYTSDIHIPGAFRHWIGFPDHLFPQAWRNLR